MWHIAAKIKRCRQRSLTEFLTASQEPDSSSQLTLITTSLLQLDAFSGVRSKDFTDHREGKKILSGKYTFSSSLAQILRFYHLQQSLNGLRTWDWVMTPSAAIPQNSQQSSSTTALDETSFSAETTESVNLCVMAPSAAIPQNSQQSSSTTALDETSFSAETTESVNLCEWRAVRSQQDEEYNASLLADIEKEKDCDPVNVAQPPVDSPFVQSSVALSPVQSPVALSPVQSPVALSPVQSPVALSPVQSLPSVQPSVALFTAQTPFINFNFEDQPKEPIVIDIDEETPLSSPSPQQSDIVDLSLIDQGRSVALDEVDLQTILKKLQSTIDGNICPTANQINVFRENILQCSLQAVKRRRFNPQAKLDVVFVDAGENGEGAIDEGGPTREYLRLLMRAIHQSNVFQGHEKDRSLALDTQALENRLYASVGKMIAMCVVHGGVGPHFFSERLFQQICGMPTSSASVDEVGDHTLREQLIKIQEATTVQEANCAIAEAADSLSIIGALRYTSHLTERNSLIQSAAEFFVNGRLRAALDQFSEGLQTLGLLEEMQKYPALFYDMFVNEQRPLRPLQSFLCELFPTRQQQKGKGKPDHMLLEGLVDRC
ncbi:uncharacterized protein LOC143710316 [Siphateles boraxobius]|uniref:uncharacterized protein LOC143710316 n=1 Tax=Siphateles boraxobius TaxID=180520 RepID=UPI004064C368